MKCNVGKKDKIFRWVVALLGLILGFIYNPWFYLLTVLGAVTASMSFCPLYKLLGMSTCDVNHDNKSESHNESCCTPDNKPAENDSTDDVSVVDSDKSETSQE